MEAAIQPPRRSFFREWVMTVDHKKIGIMYGVTAIFFFLIGGLFALLVRTDLLIPGGVFPAQTYNEFYTMHATVMIFAVIIPILTGAFGNYLIPLQIGARDMAFPRMNALSYWLYFVSGLVLLASMIWGMPDAGWTSYPPYSITSQGPGIDLWVTAIHIAGLSSILGAINFVVTILKMRAPGMTLNRMPLFVWSMLVTAFMQIFGTPALAGAVTTLLLDRHFHRCRNRDNHGRDHEGDTRRHCHTRNEHVVSPHEKPEEANGHAGVGDCLIPENRFARKYGNYLGNNSKGGQYHDVHSRV